MCKESQFHLVEHTETHSKNFVTRDRHVRAYVVYLYQTSVQSVSKADI